MSVATEEEERLRNVCDEFAVDVEKNEMESKKLRKEGEEKQTENEKLNGECYLIGLQCSLYIANLPYSRDPHVP